VIDPFLVRSDLKGAKDVPLLFKLARPLMIRPARAARWVASTDLTTRPKAARA
jgi:hypothetical protein